MPSNRRDFLKRSLGVSALLSLAPTAPGFLQRAALAAAEQEGDRILVVLELPGGNDGLNTVVPYADDQYGRNRFTLRLKEREVLKIDSLLGFHPRMPGFMKMFKEGRLGVVQGVGYPNQDPGHPEAMRVWQTASPTAHAAAQTGWLARAVDRMVRPDEARVPAVFMGDGRLPFALNAERSIVPAVHSLDQLTLRAMPGSANGSAQERLRQAAQSRQPAGGAMLDFVRRSTVRACSVSRQIESCAKGQSTAEYPPLQLAGVLRTIAQLIRADLGIRIFFTELGGGDIGGFDNHANQRDNHAAVLNQLSESVAAFIGDLARDKLLDRVLLMTFSEFGRTLVENGRRGTDHGAAAPVFLAGGRVRGGLTGPHPSMTELENGGPKHHTDFRRVYATVLEHWLGIDSEPVLGGKFPPLDVLA
jgi:uncharacterized protein (DUF1501 family)